MYRYRYHHEQRRTQGRPRGGRFGCIDLNGNPTVLIPANELDRAKGRLASLLDERERVHLFLVTLRTVVSAVNEAGLEPLILTRDTRIRDLLGLPATVVDEDPAVSGLNAQLTRALETVASEQVLILHADLPLASAASLTSVVEAAPAPPSVTLVRSRDGGTNAMLLDPPGRFPLAYGRQSFAAHLRAAEAAGCAVGIVEAPDLAFDIDTIDDCWALLDTERGAASPAGILLSSFALRERLVTDQ